MNKYAELKDKLRKLIGVQSMPFFIAEVVKVNGSTCTVKFSDLEIPDVRLQATENSASNYFRLTPKKGSKVLVVGLDTAQPLDDLVILKTNEIEKIEYSQDGLKWELDATTGKMGLSNNSTSLLDIMNNLTSILNSFSVLCPTPAGLFPSEGIEPTTIFNLNLFENKFKTLLK
jgi:hypothetical protein